MIPFVGGSYELKRKKADVQRTINMCPTPIESGTGKAKIFLQSIPGLRQFGETPPVPPPPPPPHVCVGGPVWTQRAASSSRVWNAIAYGAGKFVAGGGASGAGTGAASVMFSTDDGHTWTDAATAPIFSGTGLVKTQMMAYGNGMFVCANGGGVNNCATSTDGSHWTSGINIPNGSVQSIFFDGTNFIAVCGASSECCTSPDGVTWTSRTMPHDSWAVGGTGGGVTVILAGSGNTAISIDHGASWVAGGTAPVGVGIYGSASYGNGVFVAVPTGVSQRCLYSLDMGATWHLSNIMTLSMIIEFGDVGFYQGAFLVVDKTGQTVCSSTDGISYTTANLLPVSVATSWAFTSNGDGKYAAVGAVSAAGTVEASGEC